MSWRLGAELDPAVLGEARAIVERMKARRRGPFAERPWWFLDHPGQSPRPAPGRVPGSIQFCTHTAERGRLAELGWSVGTLYVSVGWATLWDAERDHDRLRQLLVERHLVEVDDGWVMRRARTFRGCVQREHEERCGQVLLEALLSQPEWLGRSSHLLLAREATRVVPHDCRAGDRTRAIRRASDVLGKRYDAFFDLRVRIHSAPGPAEVVATREWLAEAGETIDDEARETAEGLIVALDELVATAAWRRRLRAHLTPLQGDPLGPAFAALAEGTDEAPTLEAAARSGALLARIRDSVCGASDGPRNVRLLTASLDVEEALRAQAFDLLADDPSPMTLVGLARALVDGCYGAGLLSPTEVGALRAMMSARDRALAGDPPALLALALALDRATGWIAGAVRHIGGDALRRYTALEPRARTFVDETVRASVALPLAEVARALLVVAEPHGGHRHTMDGEPQTGLRALSRGIARGPLRRMGTPDVAALGELGAIALVPAGMPDLGRVAGLIIEGDENALSHLALLARSAGIPAATISTPRARQLAEHAGQAVALRVTAAGAVHISTGPLHAMAEPAPLRVSQGHLRADIDLAARSPLPLSAVPVALRGRVVGAKSAGAAALARRFPDAVPAGVVLPFGAGLHHLPDALRRAVLAGAPTETQRQAVQRHFAEAPLDPTLRKRLRAALSQAFDDPDEAVVFVRSDSSAEDLETFTGAGLNLTVPAVRGVEAIMAAVRRVWASPFDRRAVDWRRAAGLEVAVSGVLIMRAVPCDRSGVLATRRVVSGGPGLTVATAWGIAGVVGGASAEVLECDPDGRWQLVGEAKAWLQRRLAPGGGLEVRPAPMGPVLDAAARDRLRQVAKQATEALPATLIGDGALDLEFGFAGDALHLFQARPLAEAPPEAPPPSAPTGD